MEALNEITASLYNLDLSELRELNKRVVDRIKNKEKEEAEKNDGA